MKRIFLLALILVVIAQLLVPGQMIWKWENVLSKGKLFKFQTEPVDPVNPIKGRYVALRFAEDTIRLQKSHGLKYGQDVYLELGLNSKGYAMIKKLHTKPSSDNTYYLQGTVGSIDDWSSDKSSKIFIKFPFEEYFMDEFKAPKAERIYLDSAMKPELTYALVKVYKGGGVIQDLYINNRPVKELIK